MEQEANMKFEIFICHFGENDAAKICDEEVMGKSHPICLSVSVFFLSLTLVVYIVEESVRY